MGFPSELPAMRRVTLPAPNPALAALGWIGLGGAVASALSVAPIVGEPPQGLSMAIGPGAAQAVVVTLWAGVLPAAITLRLARRATGDWPSLRFIAAYLVMLGAVVALHVSRLPAAVPPPVDVADCCAVRVR
jgi:hypothetical protein